MRKLLILFIIWLIIGLVGSNTLQNHQYGLFVLCAIVFPILSIILLFKGVGLVIQTIKKLFAPKKKYKEIKMLKNDDLYDDPATEQITLDHPEYIGILTKINKKKIVEEYLEKQKHESKK